MSKSIELTVQPCGNGKFRLGVNRFDSEFIFKKRGASVKLILGKVTIEIKTTCGAIEFGGKEKKFHKKGYDLYHKEINIWIKQNNYDNYKPKNPTKLKFSNVKNKSNKLIFRAKIK